MKQILIVILVLNCFISFSNDTITYKNSTCISFSNIQFEDDGFRLNDILSLQLEYNRNIKDYISIGGFGGLGVFDEWIVEKNDSTVTYTFTAYRFCSHLGSNFKLHILPFKMNIHRIDLYISGNVGFISFYTSSGDYITPERGHYFDYSLMIGCSFYLSNTIGLLIEAGNRRFDYHQGFNAKYGLTFRF